MKSGFSFAGPEDAPGILRIMESDAAKGPISLIYTRRPDPLSSFQKDASEVVSGVIRKDGDVIGTITCLIRDQYINGILTRVGYVTNFKRLPGNRSLINWFEVFEKMHRRSRCERYYCSLAAENEKVQKMLHKKRKGAAYAKKIVKYRTFLLSPFAPLKNPLPDAEFKKADEHDLGELYSFLSRTSRDRNYRMGEEMFPPAAEYYLLKAGGRIVAAGALWNRCDVKQYIIADYSMAMKAARIANPILKMFGYVQMPKEGAIVDFAYISFLSAEQNRTEFLKSFLALLFRQSRKKYPVLLIGTDEKNPKWSVLNSIRGLSFDTEINEINTENLDGREPAVYEKDIFEFECAFL